MPRKVCPNSDASSYREPYARPAPDPRHQSCWDCVHVEVAEFPSRRCGLAPTSSDLRRFVFGGCAAAEIAENLLGTGRTVADDCPDFKRAK